MVRCNFRLKLMKTFNVAYEIILDQHFSQFEIFYHFDICFSFMVLKKKFYGWILSMSVLRVAEIVVTLQTELN